MSLPVSRRVIALVALALVGAYQLTRPAHVSGLPRSALGGAQQAAASTIAHRADEPLRFDPPTAGHSSNPAYDACIDQPSVDGALIDCQLLLLRAPMAVPRRPLH